MEPMIAFDAEAALVEKLQALLEQEQSALASFQIDVIERLLDEKTQLLNQLAIQTQQRYQTLASLGYEGNETGMASWLASRNEPQIHAAWQSFQANLTRSKEINRVNSVLVTRQFNRNQQILNALNSAGTGNLYGPNGQAAISMGMRGGIVV